MAIEQLLEIVAPPANPIAAGSSGEWQAIESAIGTALPEDYKALVNLFGAGCFGGEYLCLLTPWVAWPDVWNTLSEMKKFAVDYSEMQQRNPKSHPEIPVFPQPGGLLFWGYDYNAGALCWRTEGPPSEWTIVSLDSHYSQAIREIPMGITGFITAFLTGKLIGLFNPEDEEVLELERFVQPTSPAVR